MNFYHFFFSFIIKIIDYLFIYFCFFMHHNCIYFKNFFRKKWYYCKIFFLCSRKILFLQKFFFIFAKKIFNAKSDIFLSKIFMIKIFLLKNNSQHLFSRVKMIIFSCETYINICFSYFSPNNLTIF
mgnify:CR=1 FL=1